MDLNKLFKRKSVQVAFLIGSILLCVTSIRGFIDMTRQTHTRAVQREFSKAVDELEKSPPGNERAQVFLKRLKAIDPGYASVEVKTALHDYVSSMEKGLDALNSGTNTAAYDAAIADARQRFITAIKKFD